MKWFYLSLIAMLFTSSSIISLSVVAARGVPTEVMTASYFIFMAVFSLIFVYARKIKLGSAGKMPLQLIILGILVASTNFLLYEAIKIPPNPGYALALLHTETVIVAIASVSLFRSSLGIKAFIGVLLVVAGTAFLVI